MAFPTTPRNLGCRFEEMSRELVENTNDISHLELEGGGGDTLAMFDE